MVENLVALATFMLGILSAYIVLTANMNNRFIKFKSILFEVADGKYATKDQFSEIKISLAQIEIKLETLLESMSSRR